MTDEEILRRLRVVRHSNWADRIRGRTISIAGIARETGMNRTYLHAIIAGMTKMGPNARRSLAQFFMCRESNG
jgi:hypothetical protein